MNNIVITTRKEAAVTDEQLYALFNSAYDQWRDNSLEYPFLHKSFEEFQKSIDPVWVTIAIDNATGEPVGMRGVACYRKKRHAFNFCLSVAPEYKRKGIATRLMQLVQEESKRLRLDIVTLSASEMGQSIYAKIGFSVRHSKYACSCKNAVCQFFIFGNSLFPENLTSASRK